MPCGFFLIMKNLSLLQLLGGAALLSAVIFGAAHLMRLESEQREMLKQLADIKTMLARPGAASAPAPSAARAQPPLPATVSLRDASVKGRNDAKLTLVEFSDFECPFCGRYSRDTFERVIHDFVDTGTVQYAFRNYPIASLHPHAVKAGEAAECARQQGKFWEMHNRLFANQQKLNEPDLKTTATAVGLDVAAYDRCMSSGSAAAKIRRDLDDGSRAGVSGTPMFFLGATQPDGSVKVLRRLSGAQPYESFKSAIDALLASS
jgi:protein-disulfide isomerase